jgi:hypothetical protein
MNRVDTIVPEAVRGTGDRRLRLCPSIYSRERLWLAIEGLDTTRGAHLTEETARKLRDSIDEWLDEAANERVSEIERKRLRAEEANLEAGIQKHKDELLRLARDAAEATGRRLHANSALRNKYRRLGEVQEKLRGL